MQPNQSPQPHQPSGPGPQPPYRPPEYTINPNLPSQRHGAGGEPNGGQHQLHQHPSGQYEVVPPPAQGSNSGSTGHNPYEFIFAPTPKKPKLGLGNDRKSLFIWLGLLVGGAVVLLIVAAIVIAALAPKSTTPGLIAIAQRQQEIIRIADAAGNQATSQDVLNFVSTADLGVSSSQQQLLAYLSAHDTKVTPIVLAADKSAQTDALLTNAISTSTYDSAVVQNLTTQLQTYQTLLQNAARQTKNTQTRTVLQSCFTAAEQLLKQAKAITAG